MYDLGRLYNSAEDYEQALEWFSKFINQSESRGSLIQLINAYKYCGQIYMRKRDRARNSKEGQEYNDEGCRLFQVALLMECQVVSQLSICEPDFKATISFSDICSAAKGTGLPNTFYEVTIFFEMIKEFINYLKFLNEISAFRHQDIEDPKFLEKRLQSYVSHEKYFKALMFLSLLETTKEKELVGQWSDHSLPRRCRLLAARKTLLNQTNTPSGSIDDKTIKRCFVQAVQPNFSKTDGHIQRKYVDDGWSEDRNEKWWHVMILYDLEDDDMKVKGLGIKDILQNICGLRVTCIVADDDDLSDDTEEQDMFEKVKNSLILLFLCGHEVYSGTWLETVQKIVEEVRSSDCERKTLLALLIDNARLPQNLHLHRWLQYHSPLFGPCGSTCTPELIEAIYRLCCFLADVPIHTV